MKLTFKKMHKKQNCKTARKTVKTNNLKLKNFAAFAVIAFFAGVVFLPAVKNISAEELVIPEAKWDEKAKLYYSMPDDDFANAIPVNTEVYSYSINQGEYLNGAGTVTIYDIYHNQSFVDYYLQREKELDAGNITEEEFYKSLYPSEYIIPEKVRIGGKEYYVTKIGTAFLHNDDGIGREHLGEVNYYRPCNDDRSSFSVKLPDTIREIQSRAFFQTTSLKDINFPENLEKIGDYAFAHSGISKIDLPESVRHVGHSAFFYVCYDTSQPLILPEGIEVDQASFQFYCAADPETKLTVKVRDLKIRPTSANNSPVFGEVENLYIEKNITLGNLDFNNLAESIAENGYGIPIVYRANNIYLNLDENQHGELPDSLKVALSVNNLFVNSEGDRVISNLFADCSVNLGELTYAVKRYGGYEKMLAEDFVDVDDIATKYPEFWQLYEKYIYSEDAGEKVYDNPETLLNYMLYSTKSNQQLKIHQSCEVKFEENGGNSVADLPKVEKGVVIDEPEISREGYELEGWYLDADFREKYAFEKGVLQNMTLYAKWKKNLESSSESSTIEGEEIPDVEPNPENPANPGANSAKNPGANSAKKFKLIAPNTAKK